MLLRRITADLIVAFLELFYHAAAMMSHRAGPINESIPATTSFVRQSFSCVRVMQILKDECPDDLPPLPIVPWSVSLAMAHAYRVFRQSKIATLRNRARNDLQTCCDILEKMRRNWWSAGTMADLGRAALKKASAGADKDNGRKQNSATDAVIASTDANVQVEHIPAPTIDIPAGLDANANALFASNQTPVDLGTMNNDLTATIGLDPSISPDWFNFDTAFENFDAVLGSSGADVSMELLRPFNFDDFGSYELPR
jgi:hypothetical protein